MRILSEHSKIPLTACFLFVPKDGMRNGTGGLRGIYGHAADGQLGAPGVDIDTVQPRIEDVCLVF